MNLNFVKTYDKELQEEILKEFRRGDKSRQNEFFENNLILALSVFKKTNKKYIDTCLDNEDLFQYLSLELWRCVQTYDVTKGFAFSTYAYPCLYNCIAKHTRDVYRGVRYGRNLMLNAKKVWAVKNRLEKQGITATNELLAKECEMDIETVKRAFEVKTMVDFDTPVYNNDGKTLFLSDIIPDKEIDFKISDFNIDINIALDKLTPKQKTCFELYFYEGKTQNEIAYILEMSQAQTSRYLKKAFKVFEEDLKPYLD